MNQGSKASDLGTEIRQKWSKRPLTRSWNTFKTTLKSSGLKKWKKSKRTTAWMSLKRSWRTA
jgi:hypothetical protein